MSLESDALSALTELVASDTAMSRLPGTTCVAIQIAHQELAWWMGEIEAGAR